MKILFARADAEMYRDKRLTKKGRRMIMSDKRLKVCLRGAAVFLAVSIVFCIAVICGVNIQKVIWKSNA